MLSFENVEIPHLLVAKKTLEEKIENSRYTRRMRIFKDSNDVILERLHTETTLYSACNKVLACLISDISADDDGNENQDVKERIASLKTEHTKRLIRDFGEFLSEHAGECEAYVMYEAEIKLNAGSAMYAGLLNLFHEIYTSF